MSERDREQGQKFLTKHFDAHVGRGAKRFHTMVPLEFQDIELDHLRPGDRIDPYDRQVCVEDSVDISLRESDYQRLLDLLGHWQEREWIDSRTKYLEQRIAFERSLREKHPAIKKAYERYRILLDMVAQGKDIED